MNINLIVQYFKVTNSKNIKYKQNEINTVLKLNCDNKYITSIHLIVEEDYNLSFLSKDQLKKIIIKNTGTRLTYKYAFDYYNINLNNQICILANADIYFDNSLEILQNICWNTQEDNNSIIICPTRYEHSFDLKSNILYGINHNIHKNSPWIVPYSESVFTQDCWIWKMKNINVNNCNFNLGTVGCDNYIARQFINSNYALVGSTKYICANHYDHLSINTENNTKGEESFKRENRVGTFNEYAFINSGDKLVDKYVSKIKNFTINSTNMSSQIQFLNITNSIDTLSDKLLNCQYSASSFKPNCEPHKCILNEKTIWEPLDNDDNKIITLKFNHVIYVSYIDIQGLPFIKDQISESGIQECSYPTKLQFLSAPDGHTFRPIINLSDNIFEGINVSNYEYIKRIYFKTPVLCSAIQIKILEYHIRPTLRLEIYYLKNTYINNIDKKSNEFKNYLFNCQYLDNNRKILAYDSLFNNIINNSFNTKFLNFNNDNLDYVSLSPVNIMMTSGVSSNECYKSFFSINNINPTEYWLKYKQLLFDNNFKVNVNILNEPIKDGICIYVYVMNRRHNLEQYFKSWLNKKVNQIIILDWSSKVNNYDIIQQMNDHRITYIYVKNESTFIRTYAQNLAVRFCKYNKVLKLDSDVTITEDFFDKNILRKGEFLVGNFMCARDENEKYTHGNVYLYLNDYLNINGYNEIITTYGHDDSDFSYRLQLSGLNEYLLDLNTLYHNPHTNEVRKANMSTVYNTNVEIFKHRFCMNNIPFWNRYFKLQQFDISKISNNYYECTRITNNATTYKFPTQINNFENEAVELVYSWNSTNTNLSLSEKKTFLSKL